jgi:sulfatase maturation enzyme AslB (radical SAM superfamily)
MGITVCDLLNFFAEEFSETTPHISWAYLPKPNLKNDRLNVMNGVFRDEIEEQSKSHLPADILVNVFRDAARLSIKNICSGRLSALTFVIGILKRLMTRQPAVAYCPAFNSQLSIAADGSIYPCFMFIGDPRMKMGNLFDESFPSSAPGEFWNRYVSEFGDSPTGTEEWYSGLMSGCVAGDYIATGWFGDRIYKSVYEAMIQEVLLGLAENGHQ